MTDPSRLTREQLPAAAVLGNRRAYQLLHHIEQDDSEAAQRLLDGLTSPDECQVLGVVLRTLQRSAARELPADRQAIAGLAMADVASLRDADDPTDWIVASAELVIELRTELMPHRAARLRLWDFRARLAYELQDGHRSAQ